VVVQQRTCTPVPVYERVDLLILTEPLRCILVAASDLGLVLDQVLAATLDEDVGVVVEDVPSFVESRWRPSDH
jgi:hypothetical protein